MPEFTVLVESVPEFIVVVELPLAALRLCCNDTFYTDHGES